MKKLIFGGFILVVVALAACSSSPVPTDQAKPVPSDRVFAPAAWLKSCKNCATVIVKRDDGTMIGAGSSMGAAIDGKKIAQFWPGEKNTLHIPAGYYVLTFDTVSKAFTVSAGQTRVYRLGWGAMGQGPRIYADYR